MLNIAAEGTSSNQRVEDVINLKAPDAEEKTQAEVQSKWFSTKDGIF